MVSGGGSLVAEQTVSAAKTKLAPLVSPLKSLPKAAEQAQTAAAAKPNPLQGLLGALAAKIQSPAGTGPTVKDTSKSQLSMVSINNIVLNNNKDIDKEM